MKLYVTLNSPYARLARIPVLEKALEDRVVVIEAKTRAAPKPSAKANRTFVTARQTLRAAPKKDIWMTQPLTNN